MGELYGSPEELLTTDGYTEEAGVDIQRERTLYSMDELLTTVDYTYRLEWTS